MDSPPFDDSAYRVKIVLAGDAETGKSCVARKMIDCDTKPLATAYNPTIGMDYMSHCIALDDEKVKLHMWDTAGDQRFRGIITSYFRGADGVMVFYDVTRLSTFNDVAYYLGEVRKRGQPDVVLMLVGNKCDLTDARGVQYETARDYADENNILYFEVSAKDGRNIELAFVTMVLAIGDPLAGQWGSYFV